MTANVHNPEVRMPGSAVGLYCAWVDRFDLLVSTRTTLHTRNASCGLTSEADSLRTWLGALNLDSVGRGRSQKLLVDQHGHQRQAQLQAPGSSSARRRAPLAPDPPPAPPIGGLAGRPCCAPGSSWAAARCSAGSPPGRPAPGCRRSGPSPYWSAPSGGPCSSSRCRASAGRPPRPWHAGGRANRSVRRRIAAPRCRASVRTARRPSCSRALR